MKGTLSKDIDKSSSEPYRE